MTDNVGVGRLDQQAARRIAVMCSHLEPSFVVDVTREA